MTGSDDAAALRQARQESPDPLVRFALADWLEEQGREEEAATTRMFAQIFQRLDTSIRQNSPVEKEIPNV